ncbi:hypothetical protein GW755_02250 [bacterium]|nr:hypothetical protein [bacterium]
MYENELLYLFVMAKNTEYQNIEERITDFINRTPLIEYFPRGFDNLLFFRNDKILLPTIFSNLDNSVYSDTNNAALVLLEKLFLLIEDCVDCARVVGSFCSNLNNSPFDCKKLISATEAQLYQSDREKLSDIDIEVILSTQNYLRVVLLIENFVKELPANGRLPLRISILFFDAEVINNFKFNKSSKSLIFEPLLRFSILGGFITSENFNNKYLDLNKYYFKILNDNYSQEYTKEIIFQLLYYYTYNFLIKQGGAKNKTFMLEELKELFEAKSSVRGVLGKLSLDLS